MRFSTAACTLSAFAPGDWKIAMPARRPVVDPEDLAVGLRAELDAADVGDARDRGRRRSSR